MRSAVNEGSSLGDAIAKHPKLFDELFVSMVRAGELAGNLDEVLTRLADFLEASQKLKSKVQGAMIYPLVMLVVGVGIMTVLMIKVIPKITSMFTQPGSTLPINTRILIGRRGFFGRNILWLFLLAIIGDRAVHEVEQVERGQPVWHAFVLRLPVLGELVRTINVGRFCAHARHDAAVRRADAARARDRQADRRQRAPPAARSTMPSRRSPKASRSRRRSRSRASSPRR